GPREAREQHPASALARETGSAVHRYHRLPGTRPTGHPRRSSEVTVRRVPLRGVQVDHPLLPLEREGALQLLVRPHEAEAALGVWVGERVLGARWRWRRRLAAGHRPEELPGLGRQLVADLLHELLEGSRTNRLDP